jgi:uncharacterized protein
MMAVIGIFVMVTALFVIPIGLPGTWIMVGVLVVGAALGKVTLFVMFACLALAFVAEMMELAFTKKLNVKYGGTRLAFWGAIIGGIAGVMIGMPVPIIGSVIAGFLGTFAGAALATLYETRRFDKTVRVAWGALLARMFAAVAKVGAGIVILVVGGADLLF